jgi:hypothetical protein
MTRQRHAGFDPTLLGVAPDFRGYVPTPGCDARIYSRRIIVGLWLSLTAQRFLSVAGPRA